MDSTILSSFGLDTSSISGMASGIHTDVGSVITQVDTVATEAVTGGDLVSFYDAATAVLNASTASFPSGTQLLKSVSFFYGMINEYLFISGGTPVSNMNAPVANLITNTNRTIAW